jgi:hypothetical protein
MAEDDEIQVVDDAENEVIPYTYAITSYGADYPVETLVQRIEKDIIFVPEFQRKYVWTQKMASRFIESLLLGLPVPGIFLSKEKDTGRMLVIDGQQRLKSLQFFYEGLFFGHEFKLIDVQPQFEGKTYKTLAKEDKLRLDDSIVHATVVRQDEPSEDESSIFHIFERLNTGGMQLQPQEIRACIYHGQFNLLLNELNQHPNWRLVFGPPSKRLKDQELILRFLALYFFLDTYERPIKEFLNRYMARNRDLRVHKANTIRDKFIPTIDIVANTLGSNAFRPERALNASVFDAVMIGLARRLDKGPIKAIDEFVARYKALVSSKRYIALTQTGTSDVNVVNKRIKLSTDAFADLK